LRRAVAGDELNAGRTSIRGAITVARASLRAVAARRNPLSQCVARRTEANETIGASQVVTAGEPEWTVGLDDTAVARAPTGCIAVATRGSRPARCCDGMRRSWAAAAKKEANKPD